MKPHLIEYVCQGCEDIVHILLPLPTGKRAKQRKILIIEKKPTYFAYVDDFFKAHGFNIERVPSSVKAISNYKSNRRVYYAIFISHDGCDASAFETIKKIRKWEVSQRIYTKNQKLIIVAGYPITPSIRESYLLLNVKNIYENFLEKKECIFVLKALLKKHISETQHKVLNLYNQGIPHKEGAKTLQIAKSTYETHLANIKEKFGMSNRDDLNILGILLEESDVIK